MFKYINNNQSEDIFLIQGWATDFRVFDKLKINYNYILINSTNPFEIPDEIYKYCVQNNKHEINILGWSMGGFVAIDFIKKYQNKISVKNLILLSICKQYDKQTIKNIKKFLNKNTQFYLLNFYKKCFYNEANFAKLISGLKYLAYYLKLSKEELNIGLDYLENAILDVQFLNNLEGINIKIINSENDQIINSTETIKRSDFNKNISINFIKNYGHAFFWEGFKFDENL
jgi:esterase/lipase